MTTPDSDLAEGVVPESLPMHIAPPRDTFLPWHRVKKEFIRQRQWNELTRRMISKRWQRELSQPEQNWTIDQEDVSIEGVTFPKEMDLKHSLNCLMIPGDDLLDVRALWRDIQDLNCPMKYLGFHEGQGSEQPETHVHVANNAVTSLPRVAKESCVVRDVFERIGNSNSQAYQYLKKYGPYHIINLDFCGSMFPNVTKESQEYYDALHRLLIYQFDAHKSDWLLFVTTLVEPDTFHKEKLEHLCKPTCENIATHSDFAERVRTMFPDNTFDPAHNAIDLTQLNGDQMVQLFGLALGKWLLRICHAATPQWTVALCRSYQYVINADKGAVMLSLAFAFRPNIKPPADPTGVSQVEVVPRYFRDEGECALQMASSVAMIADVDGILTSDQALRDRLRNDKADLLAQAGYDRDAYLKWVLEGEISAV
jgi:hypothetical protein